MGIYGTIFYKDQDAWPQPLGCMAELAEFCLPIEETEVREFSNIWTT